MRWFDGRDNKGRRKYASKLVHGTKKDAQAELNKVLHGRNEGTYIEPSKKSLDEYLDQWLEVAARPKVRAKAYHEYAAMMRRYIRPHLGARTLAKVTALDIQAVYQGMQERGLSSRTVRYTHMVLRQALAQAVKWRLLSFNPADAVELPRQKHKEMRAMTPTEVRAFLAEAEGDRYETLFLLAVTTGLRPSEYLALKWDDINLKKGSLAVRRTVTREGRKFEEVKTARSRRTVKLQRRVVLALLEHRDRQAFERKKAGDRWQDYGLVFTSEIGTPAVQHNLKRRHFQPACERAGLTGFRLYDLRHTAATLALAAGVPPKVVSEMLGHSSAAFTMDVYSHVLPHMQEDAVARMEAMLFDNP